MYTDISDRCDGILSETDLKVKGRKLESFAQELLETIPGIRVVDRDVKNDKGSQEIDLSLWNDKHIQGLRFFDYVILVECKNWRAKAASSDISWFENKLRDGNREFGIFIAANGITGSSRVHSAAYDTIRKAYNNGKTIIVITLRELKDICSASELVELIIFKICGLSLGKVRVDVPDWKIRVRL